MPSIISGYQQAAQNNEKKKLSESEKAANRQLTAKNLVTQGYSGGSVLSGSKKEQEGQIAGLNLGALGYGQGLAQSGTDVQKLKNLLQERTAQSGADPVSAAIMSQKAGQVANAQRGLAQSGVKGGGR